MALAHRKGILVDGSEHRFSGGDGISENHDFRFRLFGLAIITALILATGLSVPTVLLLAIVISTPAMYELRELVSR